MITTVNQAQPNQIKVILNTRRQLILAIVFGFLALTVLLAVCLPKAMGLMQQYQDLQSEKQKLSKLQSKLVSLDNTIQLADQASLEITDTILPSKKPLLELLTSLRRVEAISGVKIINLALSPGLIASSTSQLAAQTQARRSQVGYDVLDLDMSVKGNFSQIQDFMQLLEKIAPFTTIANFTLSDNMSVASESAREFNSSITTGTYFYTKSDSSNLSLNVGGMSQKERDVLAQLQTFQKATMIDQTQVQGGGATDLFGVSGWEELLKNQPK